MSRRLRIGAGPLSEIRLHGIRRDGELALRVRGTRAWNTGMSRRRYRKPRANRIRTRSVSIPRTKRTFSRAHCPSVLQMEIVASCFRRGIRY